MFTISFTPVYDMVNIRVFFLNLIFSVHWLWFIVSYEFYSRNYSAGDIALDKYPSMRETAVNFEELKSISFQIKLLWS